MAAYATVSDVQGYMTRTMSSDEQTVCGNLLDQAALIIDAYNKDAAADAKKTVSCRMVLRAMGNGTDSGVPMGASQGSMSALGYTQSWTMGTGGAAGELYLGRMEKKLLGVGNRLGTYSSVQALVPTAPEVPV